MGEEGIELAPIGRVESPLDDLATAPKQGDEGAPDAWLVIAEDLFEGLDGIEAGDSLLVLTWLDRARRDVLEVHPRSDPSRPVQGVFGTRSPTAPTRSACTGWRSWRSIATACGCANSRRSTGRRSSTSSPS